MPYISQKDLMELRRVRQLLYMDTCVFRDKSYNDITPTVREATRLWRYTWILPPINRILEKNAKVLEAIDGKQGRG